MHGPFLDAFLQEHAQIANANMHAIMGGDSLNNVHRALFARLDVGNTHDSLFIQPFIRHIVDEQAYSANTQMQTWVVSPCMAKNDVCKHWIARPDVGITHNFIHVHLYPPGFHAYC